MTERKQVEEELNRYRDHLEQLVAERTAELTRSNEVLRQEIIERKQVEQALRQSESQLRLAVEAGQLGTWDWDIVTNRISFGGNAAQLISAEPDGTYEAFLEKIDPVDREAVKRDVSRSIAEGTPHNVEFRHTKPDGTVRWMMGRGRPYLDATGQVVRMSGIVQDITERKLIEVARMDLLYRERIARAKAEEADALKLKFLAMISHELRTPLAAIKGFATTLLAEDVIWDEASQRDFLNIINDEADKLTELVEQLLDVSRLQAGTLRIQPAPQSLLDIAKMSVAQIYSIITNHEIVMDIPDDLPLVMADRNRIVQVISNLIDNAVKYSPEHTQITLSAQKTGSFVQIDVSDKGYGIAPEDRPYVFEMFRQVENKLRKQKGAGLGLAICKGLVEAHGGRIWIQEQTTIGTTISFTLPVA